MLKVDPVANKNRATLTKQRSTWSDYINDNIVYDIFCHSQVVTINDYALDHFVPWSYVTHDFLWNLTPIQQSLNSMKSDRILTHGDYISKLSEQQYYLYSWIHDNNKKEVEDYITVSLNDLTKDKFIVSYQELITTTNLNAIRQGFREVKELII